jgi:hypothetical protein
MDATVPLWAFVALGLAAPAVALLSVLVTTRAENRRSHRNWLRQTKYESYDRLFSTYFPMKEAFSDYLDAPEITESNLDKLRQTSQIFKDQFERTGLVASLRVSLAMEREMVSTWFKIYYALQSAEVGNPPPEPPGEWGAWGRTRDAARYDLGVRRDPERFGSWRDRDHVVRYGYAPTSLHGKWWQLRDRLRGKREDELDP